MGDTMTVIDEIAAEPSAPVAPDWPTRCAALESDGISARKRVAALEADNAALREGLKHLLVYWEGDEWITAQEKMVAEVRALLQGQGGDDGN